MSNWLLIRIIMVNICLSVLISVCDLTDIFSYIKNIRKQYVGMIS